MDLALYDQIIEIKFDYVPRNKMKYLNSFLVEGASNFITWALTSSDLILQEQIRGSRGTITIANPINMFIISKLYSGPKESISLSLLLSEFSQFMGNSLIQIKNHNTTSFFIILERFCYDNFRISITKYQTFLEYLFEVLG